MPTVQTNDVETYYERRGEGPPLVFVHASIVDGSMWGQQVDALSAEYTTIVYDLRGQGRTGGSAIPSYSMDLFAEDLRALLTALDIDRPVLCGHSMGGAIAQVYAARYPENVAGLILADTFTPTILTRGEWFLRRVAMNALIPPVRLIGYERVEKANVWLTERFHGGAAGDYVKIQRLRETSPEMTPEEFAKAIRAMTRFHELSVDLSTITAPTLVLYGENDLPFIERHAVELAGQLPDVDVDVIPGAGHAAPLDDPEYFTTAVREFLSKIRYGDRRHGRGGNVETGPG